MLEFVKEKVDCIKRASRKIQKENLLSLQMMCCKMTTQETTLDVISWPKPLWNIKLDKHWDNLRLKLKRTDKTLNSNKTRLGFNKNICLSNLPFLMVETRNIDIFVENIKILLEQLVIQQTLIIKPTKKWNMLKNVVRVYSKISLMWITLWSCIIIMFRNNNLIIIVLVTHKNGFIKGIQADQSKSRRLADKNDKLWSSLKSACVLVDNSEVDFKSAS